MTDGCFFISSATDDNFLIHVRLWRGCCVRKVCSQVQYLENITQRIPSQLGDVSQRLPESESVIGWLLIEQPSSTMNDSVIPLRPWS